MKHSKIYPIMLGMNPANKEVVVCRSKGESWKGFDVFIFAADFKDDKEPGDIIEDTDMSEIKSLLGWLHFTNAYSMKKFGELLVRYADKKGGKT